MAYDPTELESKSPAELQQRRQAIVSELMLLPKTYEDAPTETLQELAFITGALRRKTAGPPKVARASKRSPTPAATTDDLADLME